MQAADIPYLRLYNHRISSPRSMSPQSLVTWMGAFQAQDYAGGLWSLGVRLPRETSLSIESSLNNATIIRTWPMRGTLHFIPGEDASWMLHLLTPQIVRKAASRYRELQLDEATFISAEKVLRTALATTGKLTREQAMTALADNHIDPRGQRGYHILGHLSQQGILCLGAMEGKQQTFVLLQDWAPKQIQYTREQSLAELAKRYIQSHGPVTRHDFARWSGLRMGDAIAAFELTGNQFIRETIEDKEYWMPQPPKDLPKTSQVYLLPGFDEYILGYADRSHVLDPIHAPKIVPGGNGVFRPTIIIDGQVAGVWRRAPRTKHIQIESLPFKALTAAQSKNIEQAAQHYGAFLNTGVKVSHKLHP